MNARLQTLGIGIVSALAISSFVGCSKDEEKKSGWDCAKIDVPMGEVVRCTANVATNDIPQKKDVPSVSGGTGEGDGVFVRTYDTPPAGGGSSSDSSSESSDDSSSSSSSSDDSSYECKPGSDDARCPSEPSTSGSAPPSDGNKSPGPDECAEVPDLPYCNGSSSSSSSSTPSPTPPSAPSGPWTCTQDMEGKKTCDGPPSCAKGTHPSKCGACVMDGEADDCVPPSEGGCWVTGGGFIVEPSLVPAAAADGHDNFGGNAKQMKKGGVQGHWNHVDHGTKNHAKGRPEYIYCRHVDEPGPGQPGGKKGFNMNQIYFGGPAEWRSNDTWADGYWFDVVAKDHGEPGSQPHAKNGFMVDTYHFTIRKMDDPAKKVSGAVVYELKGGLVGGNIQIHPPNNGHPGVQSPLPTWVALEP